MQFFSIQTRKTENIITSFWLNVFIGNVPTYKCTHTVTWTHFSLVKLTKWYFSPNTLVKNINIVIRLSGQMATKLLFFLNTVLHFSFQACRRT